MKKIPLRNRRGGVNAYALVDDEDYAVVSRFRWHIISGRGKRYAVHNLSHKLGGGHARMHRVVLWCPKGYEIDHINGNGLDNRRKNLRICTHQENTWNSRKNPNSSGFHGVCWKKREQLWVAQITKSYKKIWLGLFKNKIDAAKAYDEAAKKLHGKFAQLNFPGKRKQRG